MPRTIKRTPKNVITMPRAAAASGTTAIPTPEDVARRAFELFCERGGEHGHDLEDWLRAERELRQNLGISAA
jgi:hypothetical protein